MVTPAELIDCLRFCLRAIDRAPKFTISDRAYPDSYSLATRIEVLLERVDRADAPQKD